MLDIYNCGDSVQPVFAAPPRPPRPLPRSCWDTNSLCGNVLKPQRRSSCKGRRHFGFPWLPGGSPDSPCRIKFDFQLEAPSLSFTSSSFFDIPALFPFSF